LAGLRPPPLYKQTIPIPTKKRRKMKPRKTPNESDKIMIFTEENEESKKREKM